MRWNIEWNDIHTICGILKISKKMSKSQMRTVYSKLDAEKELRFGSGLGEVFLLEYARIVHGISDYNLDLLEKDARYIERTIQVGMEWEDDIWRDLYELLVNKKNHVLHTSLGETFIEIFHDKLILEENQDYQELQHDFRQIEKIYKRVDFENAEKSKKTVRLLAKNESGIFHTKIGFFFMHQMKKELDAEESSEKIQRIGLKLLIYILLIGCISFGSIGIYVKIHSGNKLRDLQEKKSEFESDASSPSMLDDDDGWLNIEAGNQVSGTEQGLEVQMEDGKDRRSKLAKEKQEKSRSILPQYKKIAEEYPDFWGWIKIPDTKIDYPIMQSKKKDFYLTHDYEGEESREGAVFVDIKSNNAPLDNYVVVYGHNMKNGNMFGELDRYEDETFFQKHNTIYLDTSYEKGEYEVLTVLKTHILNQEDEGFRYYQQFGYEDKMELGQIKDFVKNNQLFEQKSAIKYGDELLLLSTCEYSQENGRFVVVARRK